MSILASLISWAGIPLSIRTSLSLSVKSFFLLKVGGSAAFLSTFDVSIK
jgi:hypothetical protein